jgi:serine/threonine protein kinase
MHTQSGRNIIKFYGGYKHSNAKSACLILEYANRGNLESYMEKTPPPQTPEETKAFQIEFWNLSEALRRLHVIPVEHENYEGYILEIQGVILS